MTSDQSVTPSCFWCDDPTPEHRHYTVLVYKDGSCLGRLTPDGYAVRKKFHSAILGRVRAQEIAAEINEEGVFTAKARPF